MRLEVTEHPPVIRVFLSRRNLTALLAKLDGWPEGSACTIVKGQLMVCAERDDAHYRGRIPGAMHPSTELAIGGVVEDED
jgi:hypothetical protein